MLTLREGQYISVVAKRPLKCGWVNIAKDVACHPFAYDERFKQIGKPV